MRIEAVCTGYARSVTGLPAADLDMLKRHAGYGGLSLVCHTADDAASLYFFSRCESAAASFPSLACNSVIAAAFRITFRCASRGRTLSAPARKAGRYC